MSIEFHPAFLPFFHGNCAGYWWKIRRIKKDLEGRRDPLSEVVPSPSKPPSSSPNFPHIPATFKNETNFRFLSGGDMGEVFVGLGGGNYLKGAASRLFGERNT